MDLESYIRSFPDFPSPGILFRDISPMLKSPSTMQYVAECFKQYFSDRKIDIIAGIESRGLIFASSVAMYLDMGFIMIRKIGKLPGQTKQQEYELEYNNSILEIQKDAIQPDQNVLLVDDLLATGGTAKASIQLIEQLKGNIVGVAFVIELTQLAGKGKLDSYDVYSLVKYDD